MQKWNPYDIVCRFCKDRGCLACDGEREKLRVARENRAAEREKEYRAKFGDGDIEPIFTAHFDNPAEMEALKTIFGREAIVERLNNAGGDLHKFMELTTALAKDAKWRLAQGNKDTDAAANT